MPEDDADLQLRIAITGYAGPAGHCDLLATENAIKTHFVSITVS